MYSYVFARTCVRLHKDPSIYVHNWFSVCHLKSVNNLSCTFTWLFSGPLGLQDEEGTKVGRRHVVWKGRSRENTGNACPRYILPFVPSYPDYCLPNAIVSIKFKVIWMWENLKDTSNKFTISRQKVAHFWRDFCQLWEYEGHLNGPRWSYQVF